MTVVQTGLRGMSVVGHIDHARRFSKPYLQETSLWQKSSSLQSVDLQDTSAILSLFYPLQMLQSFRAKVSTTTSIMNLGWHRKQLSRVFSLPQTLNHITIGSICLNWCCASRLSLSVSDLDDPYLEIGRSSPETQ